MNNRIRELREDKGLTQSQLSEEVGISLPSISAYERGERNPKIKAWQSLADYFDVPVGYLQGNSDIREKFLYEDYDYNQAVRKSSYKFNWENYEDEDKKYIEDEKSGLNDVRLNQYDELVKMLYSYGNSPKSGRLSDKKLMLKLRDAMETIFSNALYINEDVRDNLDASDFGGDHSIVDEYASHEVNRYIDELIKHNPYFVNNHDLNNVLSDKDEDVYYKNYKLSEDERDKLKNYLDKLEHEQA